MMIKHAVAGKANEQTSKNVPEFGTGILNDNFYAPPRQQTDSSVTVEAISSFIQEDIPVDLVDMVKKEADILVAKLSSKPGLPRSLVSPLIQDFTSFSQEESSRN